MTEKHKTETVSIRLTEEEKAIVTKYKNDLYGEKFGLSEMIRTMISNYDSKEKKRKDDIVSVDIPTKYLTPEELGQIFTLLSKLEDIYARAYMDRYPEVYCSEDLKHIQDKKKTIMSLSAIKKLSEKHQGIK